MKAWLVAIALLVPEVAHADEYEQRFVEGNELFDQGKWRESRAAYEAAYKLDPRPIVLFNIASTYFKERDLVNARLFYERYLAAGASEPAVEAKARERIDEIDRTFASRDTDRPPPPRGYPREVVARPLTLPRGTFAVTGGSGVSTYETVDDSGARETHSRVLGFVGGALGVARRVELGAELAFASSGTAFGFATLGVADGFALRITGAIGFGGATSARLGAPLRVRIGDNVAIVTVEDLLVVDTGHDAFLRLPIGAGLQVTKSLYASAGVRIVDAPLSAGSTRFLSAVTASLEYATTRDSDIVLAARFSDETEGSAFVRIRF